jgi:hypothetical protein
MSLPPFWTIDRAEKRAASGAMAPFFHKRIYLALILSILVGCQPIFAQESLPTPKISCPSQFDWRGLRPGVSTIEDVIKKLGKPASVTELQYDKKRVIEYLYRNGNGYLNNILQTRILFSQKGIVDWIEIPASQNDIKFRSVEEIYDQIGVLDTIYINNNYNPAYKMYDVLGGPAEVYVWSGCGLAVIGIPSYLIGDDQQLHSVKEKNINNTDQLEILYPPPINLGGDPSKTPQSAVLIEAIFIPTTYEGFEQSYQYQFTYLDWSLWDKLKINYRKN